MKESYDCDCGICGICNGTRKPVETMEVDWAGDCPKCGCGVAKVDTKEGSYDWLVEGDKAECRDCGHGGTIEADDGIAWIVWDKEKEDAS